MHDTVTFRNSEVLRHEGDGGQCQRFTYQLSRAMEMGNIPIKTRRVEIDGTSVDHTVREATSSNPIDYKHRWPSSVDLRSRHHRGSNDAKKQRLDLDRWRYVSQAGGCWESVLLDGRHITVEANRKECLRSPIEQGPAHAATDCCHS